MKQQRNYCHLPILMVVTILSVAVLVQGEARSTHEAFNAHCTDVIAVDTIEIWTEERGEQQVRLIGVDATVVEEHLPLYARALIHERIDGKMARVEVYDRPSEEEIVGRVIIDHYDLSFTLISQGLARYDGKAPAVLRLYLAEEKARQDGRGIWSAEKEKESKSSEDLQRKALSDVAWKLDYRRTFESTPGLAEHSDEEIKMDIGNWIGEHKNLLIANWGTPDVVEPLGTGGEVLSYDRCEELLMKPDDSGCELRFFVDAEGKIYDRQWR